MTIRCTWLDELIEVVNKIDKKCYKGIRYCTTQIIYLWNNVLENKDKLIKLKEENERLQQWIINLEDRICFLEGEP